MRAISRPGTRRLGRALWTPLIAAVLAGSPGQGSAAGVALSAAAAPVLHGDPLPQDLAAARQAILELRRADAGLAHFFDCSVGYAVFATVRSGLPGAGGADGMGVLFVDGLAIGSTRLTDVAATREPGARSYTEVVFLETRQALAAFEAGAFTLGARAVSVDAAARSSARATFEGGSSVFTLGWTGPGGGEALGGQQFSYRPLQPRLAASVR